MSIEDTDEKSIKTLELLAAEPILYGVVSCVLNKNYSALKLIFLKGRRIISFKKYI
jgi:hypothetical protein